MAKTIKGFKFFKGENDKQMQITQPVKENAPVAPVPDKKYIKGTPEWKAHKEAQKPRTGHPTNVKEEAIDEVAPPGFEGTVKAMKKHKEIDNPWALAWWMKNKGMKSHKKADGSMKEESEQIDELSRDTLLSYANKVSLDSQKHSKDPTKRSGEKASRSVTGYARAHNRLEKPVKEETEMLDEKSQQARRNKTYKNLMAASKGARVNREVGLTPADTGHKNNQQMNKAIGRAVYRGEVHEGIAQMFKVIEFARMMVGTKAIATLSAGYLQALAYAKTRVQGPDLTKAADKASPRVTIINHPDVRRSLMVQKSYAEAMRALVLYTASIQDEIVIKQASGEDAAKLAELEALNDLLLPIVKGYGSEKSWTLLGTESLQTFGGSGFTQDWPLEQYVRDAKIDTLYEGTTAIQGLDFFFRKIVKDGGKAIRKIAKEIGAVAASGGANGEIKAQLGTALNEVNTAIGALVGIAMASQEDPKEIYKVGLNTSRLLMNVGDIICAWLLIRQADIAVEKLATAAEKDKAFYQGKIAAAKFFVDNVLPHIAVDRSIIEKTDNSIMELSENAF